MKSSSKMIHVCCFYFEICFENQKTYDQFNRAILWNILQVYEAILRLLIEFIEFVEISTLSFVNKPSYSLS